MAKKKDTPKLSKFTWSGLDRSNRPTSGDIQAANMQAAKMLLRSQGVRVKKLKKESKPLFSAKAVKVNDIVFFTRQLSTMIEAGIPIASALRGISIGHENESVKKLIGEIREDVETGTALSISLKKHPKHFNQLYTALVSVGEASGTLDGLMYKIAGYLEKIEHIKGKIRAALFYPGLVIVVAFSIVAVLLIFVIPEFESLFSDFGSELPALTRYVVAASEAFQKYWLWIVIGIIAFSFAMSALYKRSQGMQFMLDKALLRVPVFGPIINKAIIARICRTLATMFGAGIPLVDSLETVSTAAGNRLFSRGLLAVRRDVSTGRNLEESLGDTELFPGMMLQMVATGEESGELEKMLDKVAEFFETEVDNSIAIISSLVEPFLIIILGGIVGTLVVAMYLPIFQLGTVF